MLRAPVLLALAPLLAMGSDATSHFAKLDGNKVRYLSYGEGKEAVVFVHGWSCDLTFWRMQAPVYENRRSLLIDLPGHGLSDKPKVAYTMELFARAIDAVMNDAKVEKAILVGHSMGTPVSVQYLRTHPAKVSKLVIVDGFIPEPPRDQSARARQTEDQKAYIEKYRGPEYRATAMQMMQFMFTPQSSPDLRREIESKMLSTPQYVMGSAMEGMMTAAPLKERWPELPVLALMVKRATSDLYRDFLKEHFHLVGFEVFDAGHFLMMEQPDRFNSLLTAFLDGKLPAAQK